MLTQMYNNLDQISEEDDLEVTDFYFVTNRREGAYFQFQFFRGGYTFIYIWNTFIGLPWYGVAFKCDCYNVRTLNKIF